MKPPWTSPARFRLLIVCTVALAACRPEPPAAGGEAELAPPLLSVTVNPPRRLTDFALLDHHGALFNRASLAGAWHLMFFGFTRCPDICPPTLAQLGAVQRAIKANGATPPRVIFVTVDPVYDTPETMALYLANFRLDADGVTGERPQLEALALQLGIYHRPTVEPPPDTAPTHQHHQEDAVTFDHSSQVLLLDPEARLIAILPQPLDPKALADLLPELMSAADPTPAVDDDLAPAPLRPRVLTAAPAGSSP